MRAKLVTAVPTDYNNQSQEILTDRESGLSCPYFMPVERLENGRWPHPARLPLGCGWSGHCTAPGHEGQLPALETLENSCNLGYASGCAWTPAQRVWDAVRFAVAAPGDDRKKSDPGAEISPRILRLVYVCEHDHHPVVSGELRFDLSQAAWLSRHEDARVQKMAECFLETYLKKKA